MKVNFNVTGADRKGFVKVIGEKLGMKPVYQGMPSAAYQIGDFRVDKDGSLEWDDAVAITDAEHLVESLVEEGYEATIESATNARQDAYSAATEEETGLTISIPLENVLVGNLTKILDAKAELIKKALGVDDVRIEVDPEKVSFPWFQEIPEPDVIQAYQKFIAALCKMSKEQKRVNSIEREIINEKYSFRCFLLRLGFIGDKYKTDRKILLRNLSGNSAFKGGTSDENSK